MALNPLFAELALTKDRLNRFFGRDEFWDTDAVLAEADWMPPVDILEGANEITIKAELPGIERKDVSIMIDNNVLTLKGERSSEKEVRKEKFHRMERARGFFSRSFAMPAFVDADNIRAEFKNGLLTVALPKKTGSKARTVDVNAA